MAAADRWSEIGRARALLAVGRWAQAAEVLATVLAREPDDAEALCLLATCHDQAGQPKLMLEAADRAIAADPAYEWALRLRAHALLALKRRGRAEAAARAAVALAPGQWRTHATLAEVLLARRGTRRILAARRSADTVLRLAPHTADAHVLDSAVRLRMADYGGARSACRQALALDPENQAALHNLAVADLARERVGTAARKFTDALALAPQDTLTGEGHAESMRGVLWRHFDLLALAAAAHVLLFNAIDTTLGSWRRPAELVAAALILIGFAWLVARTWRAQPRAIRWRFRADIGKDRVISAVVLMVLAAFGLLVSAYGPAPGSGPDTLGSMTLAVTFLFLIVRVRNMLFGLIYRPVRRLWFRLWSAPGRRRANQIHKQAGRPPAGA